MTALWRVFPWDPDATAGAPFTPEAVPLGQGSGRFDLPALTPVRYFAEAPEHAVAEVIQGLRNQSLDAADLVRVHPLALVEATLTPESAAKVVDLCEPAQLMQLNVRPDQLASGDVTTSQGVARTVFAKGAPGFRWWSALSGDWHTVVLFDVNLSKGGLRYRPPVPLTLDAPALHAAARRLQSEIVDATSRA